jgi:hypothetical protein
MFMTGLFRFALLPDVEPATFESHLRDEVFDDPGALQLTRVTHGFEHRLLLARTHRSGDVGLDSPVPGTQYVWEATVSLQTDAGYDFAENAERVQERVAGLALLIGVESYVVLGGATADG